MSDIARSCCCHSGCYVWAIEGASYCDEHWGEELILTRDDVFPVGSDGKRHPTREELLDTLGTIEQLEEIDNPDGIESIVAVIKRLATVAPEENYDEE